MLSQNAVNGAVDSRVTIELANGVYDVMVDGESNTTGNYELRVFLAGDETGNQQVTQQEYAMASAASLQAKFGINHVAAMVFAKQGINISQNLYRAEFDINGDGLIDEFDRSIISMNQGAPIPTVTLSADQAAPTIQASLSNDTGRSNTDGITNDLAATISGSISDNGTIASFTASIDGSTAVELGTLLGQNFATGGNFSLNLARLETIAGTGAGSLTNDGPHTLTPHRARRQGEHHDPAGSSIVHVRYGGTNRPHWPRPRRGQRFGLQQHRQHHQRHHADNRRHRGSQRACPVIQLTGDRQHWPNGCHHRGL